MVEKQNKIIETRLDNLLKISDEMEVSIFGLPKKPEERVKQEDGFISMGEKYNITKKAGSYYAEITIKTDI